MIYLDNQATTQCDPRVLEAMWPWFANRAGNPHSVEHAAGRAASDAVAEARAHVAALIGATPREIIFTSGATEANNLAIKGTARFAGASARGATGHRRHRAQMRPGKRARPCGGGFCRRDPAGDGGRRGRSRGAAGGARRADAAGQCHGRQ